jgi:hypothetical protein
VGGLDKSLANLPTGMKIAERPILSMGGKAHKEIPNDADQIAKDQVNDSLLCQVVSVRDKREDWIVDRNPAQERECQASNTRQDDGGGGDQ